ncbi:MAG: hypothetical protein WHS88_05915 [Anaerohalosphaeraceae bacterium]
MADDGAGLVRMSVRFFHQKGVTLLELLSVLAAAGMLIALLVPSLRRARLQAKILAVHSDLRQVSAALTCYFSDRRKYPPTREDCSAGSLRAHLYQLPRELAEGDYLPGVSLGEAKAVQMEDKFHPGYTYKYRSVGECIRDRNQISRWIRSRLWVPDGFPAESSLQEEQGQWYSEPEKSPVEWVVFSLGPNFDEEQLWTETGGRYPVPRQTWLSGDLQKGFLVRLRMKNGWELGTLESRP